MKEAYYIVLLLICLGCNKQSQEKDLQKEETSIEFQKENTPQIKEVSLKNFTYEDIARYTMSAVMYQPTKIIKVKKQEDLYFVSYIRKSDSKEFDYKIKFDGDHVIWANIDGRWRDNELDEKIRFNEEGNIMKIIQTFSDGSESIEEFKKGQ